MNAYVERLIGTIRREALDHFLLFSEKQVRKIIREYVDYYNHLRPHQGINKILDEKNDSATGIINEGANLRRTPSSLLQKQCLNPPRWRKTTARALQERLFVLSLLTYSPEFKPP